MDHSVNTLGAAIKSLYDVVAPAVDPTDPLATEQLRLVSEFLGFLRSRLPYLHDRSTLELRRAVALGRTIAEAAAPVRAVDSLWEAVADGEATLEDPRATQCGTDLAAARVGAEMRNVIRHAAIFDDDVRSRIERAVLDDVAATMDFYRGWYAPLGFDPRPDSLPAVADAIDRLAAADARS